MQTGITDRMTTGEVWHMEDYTRVIAAIRRELAAYINSNNLKALIVGLSGGIDSALCAALAEPVCRELRIPLIGRSISIETNSPEENERARIAGQLFCADFQELDLTRLFQAMAPGINGDHAGCAEDLQTKIRRGNLKARLRMIVLYDLASKHGGLVLSTDNLTEYYLGFWTLHGDHADFGMIQNLWKTEVYELSGHLLTTYLKDGDEQRARAVRLSIDAVPTDGLGITRSDCEQFGVSTYAEVDRILRDWIRAKKDTRSNQKLLEALKNNPVVMRHEGTHFKRQWPVAISREALGMGDILRK
jgi:NAD+ synthase